MPGARVGDNEWWDVSNVKILKEGNGIENVLVVCWLKVRS